MKQQKNQLKNNLFFILLISSYVLFGCASINNRYSLATVSQKDKFELFKLDKKTGEVWQFMPDRTWQKTEHRVMQKD